MGVRIREKRPGEWWVFVTHRGKRTSEKVSSRKEAGEVARSIREELLLRGHNLVKGETQQSFKTYATLWLEGYVKAFRRATTYERYRRLLEMYVFPALGSKPLDRISRGDIKALIQRLHKEGMARASLSLIRDVISGPLNQAVDEELVKGNPSRGVLKALKIKKDKRETIDPLNTGEAGKFLSACLLLHPELHSFFLTAFRTGMRLGEVLAMKWSDLDFNGKFVTVQRSYRRGVVTRPKTDKSRRVDISPELLMALQGLLSLCKRQGLEMGLGAAPEYVFHREGKPMEQNYIRRVFKRLLSKAGLREIRFHDIRHSFASILLSEHSANILYVKEQLGHSSINITVDIYGHYLSTEKKWVDLLDAHPAAPIRTLEKTEEA